MELNCKSRVRLSQNEIDNILLNERRKWKNFRIQQVRAQSKEETLRLLEAAKQEEAKQKNIIRNKLQKEWLTENEKKLCSLEKQYASGLQEFGDAHRKAEFENELSRNNEAKKLHDNKVSVQRGRAALRLLDKNKAECNEEEAKVKVQRQRVQEKEKKRALKISKMPTPPRLKQQRKKVITIPKKVMFHEAGTFATSSYIPSTLKVVKEDVRNKESAKEVAVYENEKFKEDEIKRKKKELEVKKKIEDRGKIAMEKEKTKVMFSKLMKELNEAEENHQLSDYLKADEEIEFNNKDDLSSMHRKAMNAITKEKLAEEQVKQILSQEWEMEEVIPINISKSVPHNEVEIEQASPSVLEERLNVDYPQPSHSGVMAAEDTTDRYSRTEQHLDTLGKDIHFKETVPVNELPFYREKFLVTVPSHDASNEHTTLPDSTKSDGSSFEEILVRIKVSDARREMSSTASEKSAPSGESRSVSSTSEATEYLTWPSRTTRKVVSPEVTKDGASQSSNIATSSSEITDYYQIPSAVAKDDSIWTNIKHIQKTGKKVQKLITELKQPSIPIQTPDETHQSLTTPHRVYSEEIKSESSSVRPMSKRQKFETRKKDLLEYYVRRLVNMKQEERTLITVSSVEGSGLDINLDNRLSEFSKTSGEFSKISVNTTETTPAPKSLSSISDSLSSRFSDVIIPTEGTSPIFNSSEGASSQSLKRYTSTLTSNSPVSTSYEESHGIEEVDAGVKLQIYMRLLQLQKLKQQLILKQQAAATPGQLEDEVHLESSGISSSESSKPESIVKRDSRNDENYIESSTTNDYMTPTRDGSTQSWTDLSSESSQSSKKCLIGRTSQLATPEEPPHTSTKLFERRMEILTHFQAENLPTIEELEHSVQEEGNPETEHSSHDQKNLKRSSKEGNFHESSKSDDFTRSSSRQSGNDEREGLADEGDHRASSASSVSSVPDMTEILQKFGLGWALSMIKKMDIAEENHSSDSSKL